MDLVLDSPRPAAISKPCEAGTFSGEPADALLPSLRDFIRTMRAKPAAAFQTQEAAAAFGVTPFAFIRAFKEVTGLSPQRFRAALRIERAKRLLVETDRPVTEISFDVGYNSLGTFVRIFTLLVGLPPSQLRRLARGGDPAEIVDGARTFNPLPMTASTVRGTVEPPLPRKALVVAGLFPQGLPAGLPIDGCFVDPVARDFRLAWPCGRRRVSLLIAAIGCFTLKEAWVGNLPEIEVSSLSLAAAPRRPVRVRLRAIDETDPPFLTPIPLLLLLQSRRSAGGRVSP